MKKKIDYHALFTYEHYYHVYNRGNNKENLFHNDGNYYYFLTKWNEYLAPFLEFYSYCLMPNHFHFIVKVKAEKIILSNLLKEKHGDTIASSDSIPCYIDINRLLEERFRRLFITYSQALNKEQGRTGSLFQKRFKRIHINSDEYFIWLVHYIHHNPIHHKFLNDSDNSDTIPPRDSIAKLPLCSKWKYSSFNAIVGNGSTNIEREDVLRWFGGVKNFIEFHERTTKLHEVYPFGIDEFDLETDTSDTIA